MVGNLLNWNRTKLKNKKIKNKSKSKWEKRRNLRKNR